LSLLLERTQAQLEDSNAKVTETERRLQSAEIDLQVRTQENLALVQSQEVLNQNLQVVTRERDDAMLQKDVTSHTLVETGERLQAQTEQLAVLESKLECAKSRKQDLSLEIEKERSENNSLRQKIKYLEHQFTRDIETAKSKCEAAAKLALDGKINDGKAIIEQWEMALNAERENYRVLEQGIEERISDALDTQLDELNAQLNDIVCQG
jgi:chromosome segregation ATPase